MPRVARGPANTALGTENICVGAVQRRLLPWTPSRSLGTHEFMTLVTPLSIEALNAATVHDKDGTATSLANLFTGNKTLVLVLRHCL